MKQPHNAGDPQPPFVSILGRAFSIMDCLLKSDVPLGLSELAREAGIPKANAFRILKTLEALHAVALSENGYVLGSRMIAYGSEARKSDRFFSVIIPCLQSLSSKCGETVNFGVPYEESILMLQTEHAEQNTLVSFLPPVTPMYCSSIGKLFLANKDDACLTEYFAQNTRKRRTIHTIVTKARFMEERARIRGTSIAYDREEYDYGLTCIAAPVYLNRQLLIAGISLSGPTSRLSFKGYARLEEMLLQAANFLSEALSAMELPPDYFTSFLT